jgi:hypothetical protein
VGTDPLAATLAAKVAAAEAAMAEAAINLGLSADALTAQVGVGDVLSAIILPAQNGQDFIEVLGQRVSAQLPPGVHPGETLLLQVTRIDGTQIVVRNLGLTDTAPPQAQPRLSEPAANVSPPRAVFVAASVRQPSQPAPRAQEQPAVQTHPAAQTPPAPVRGVEARIAAAQTTAAPAQHSARPLVPERGTIPPLIPPRSAVQQPDVRTVTNSVSSAVQRVVQTVSDFLRSARVPDTPLTRTAASIAPHAPERLPSVLQRLDAALPREAQDPRIATLRTLVGFTARINPANAETLPAQIASYVSNVVVGVEAKIGQLLQAHVDAAPSQNTAPADPSPSDQTPSDPVRAQVSQPGATIAQARIAERSAAISHDLKAVVLSLLRDPPAERTPAMTHALTETLVTLTGVQVNALSATQQDPGSVSFTLPVFYREGGKPAHVRISRDAGSRAAAVDADNFHVAFVLDTAHLGTVAIDLQAAARTVKIDVKTEQQAAAARFSDSLGALRARLEHLRYRVASAAASAVAATRRAEPKPASNPPSHMPRESKRGVDLRA